MIADRKLSFHNNLQHSVCFHVFIYPDTEGPWSGPDYPIDCNLGAPQGLGILLKILSNHYSSLFKERICNRFTSSYVTSKKYSRLVQVVYGVAPSEERGGGTIALASRPQKVITRPWSCSYGCWIYKYLYNECLSPLKLWVRIPLMAKCTRYNIMW